MPLAIAIHQLCQYLPATKAEDVASAPLPASSVSQAANPSQGPWHPTSQRRLTRARPGGSFQKLATASISGISISNNASLCAVACVMVFGMGILELEIARWGWINRDMAIDTSRLNPRVNRHRATVPGGVSRDELSEDKNEREHWRRDYGRGNTSASVFLVYKLFCSLAARSMTLPWGRMLRR